MTILITTCYFDNHLGLASLDEFLAKNLHEPGITSVAAIVEGITEDAKLYIEFKYDNVIILAVNTRPSFSDLLKLARDQTGINELAIICNSDIWFKGSSDGIREIANILSHNQHYALTLTRRDDIDHSKILSISGILPELSSSDAWIFYGKPRQLKLHKNVRLGAKDLEHHINTALIESGYYLMNACEYLAAIHLKQSTNNYMSFNLESHIAMSLGTTFANLSLYHTKCVLPLPSIIPTSQKISAIERLIPWDDFHTKYICLDLRYEEKEDLVYALNSLCHFSIKYSYTVCFYTDLRADEWGLKLLDRISSVHPRIIVQPGNRVVDAIMHTNGRDFVIASHCGVITHQMLEEGIPIYILGMSQRKVWNAASFGTEGIPVVVTDIEDENIHINQDGFFWSSLQLITCTYGSKNYIAEFLSNSMNLVQESHKNQICITHSFIDTSPERGLCSAIISYLSSCDGYFMINTSDPGLYECWNKLIRTSSDEYVSNANPDDLRDPDHCRQLIRLLNENIDIMVASSSVFPILTASERKIPIEQLRQRAGTGWFAETPPIYGLDYLYESCLDDEQLVKPKNIPHCAPVWRRALHNVCGFFQEDVYGSEADWALWCTYASLGGKFLHCRDILSGYFIDELSYGRKMASRSARINIITNILSNTECRQFAAQYSSKMLVEAKNTKDGIDSVNSIPDDCTFTSDDVTFPPEHHSDYDRSYLRHEFLVSRSITPVKQDDNLEAIKAIKLRVCGASAEYGQHRFSNNLITNALLPHHSDDADIDFLWFLEKHFVWGADPGERHSDCFRPLYDPWIGVLHVPPLTPQWAGNQFSEIFIQFEWNQSLKACRALITLSEYMKKDLELLYPDIKIYALKHPLGGDPTQVFNMDRFLDDPKLLLTGYWLRNHIGFYKWNAPFRKIHLLKDSSLDQMQREFSIYGFPTAEEMKSVERLNFLSAQDYDSLLTQSLVYLDMYDTSANNAVLECIATATPFLSRRIPAIEEYVGRDYPLFVDVENLDCISACQLVELACRASCHLRDNVDKESLTLERFRHDVLGIVASVSRAS